MKTRVISSILCTVLFSAFLFFGYGTSENTRAGSVSEMQQKNLSPSPVRNAAETVSASSIDRLSPGTAVDASGIRNTCNFFKKYRIREGDAIYQRINGKSWRENDDISLSDLMYLKMLHYDFNHDVRVGEMIVNAAIADDTLHAFRELYEQEYEIEQMVLVDDYWMGDAASTDENSMEHNNTSAFNYRRTTSGRRLSNHALGYAIDINPLQNPYVYDDGFGNVTVSPQNAASYADRSLRDSHMATSGDSHIIVSGDICESTFEKYGFSWGGFWNNPKDYQHFEK